MGKDRHGRSAADLIITVPVGTLVIDDESGELIADLDLPGKRVLAARGGKGGRGNARFATSRNRAPRQYEEGEPGEERTIQLELKLIADVGLVGMPNSGKSTLLSKVSRARPKIADYPFTTKAPVLGVVRVTGALDFVMADIPGLIEGAHEGAGMGDRFLRHVERTRVLLHLVDPSPSLTPGPDQRFDVIMSELNSYGPHLTDKPMIAVITKMDLHENQKPARELRQFLEEKRLPVHEISAVTGAGVKELMRSTARILKSTPRANE
jgi:GTP-binding protein